ncbi:MAG: hypothetical protein GY821_14865 [Gammaproteobacteria bacterium]|nr:hypothetical protein [Gammaproteobacteria bacterium]
MGLSHFRLDNALYRIGKTKWQQLIALFIYTLLSLGLIFVVTAANLMLNSYLLIVLVALLTFLCLAASRYLPGTPMANLFLVVYLLITLLLNANVNRQQFIMSYSHILIGAGFAYLFTALFTLLLPLIEIASAPPCRDRYLIHKACRITISIAIALLICHFGHIQRATWVTLSVLVVTQANIGTSVKRGIERLIGTFVGVIGGILLAHLLFAPYPHTLYLSYFIMLLTFLSLFRHYTLGIGLATALLAAAFYLLKPAGMTINQFMIARFFDTLLGIIIALSGEIFIFPKTLLPLIRRHLDTIFAEMAVVLRQLALNDTIININKQTTLPIRNAIGTLQHGLVDYQYEPLVLITQRAAYINDIFRHLLYLYKAITQLCLAKNKQLFANPHSRKTFIQLATILGSWQHNDRQILTKKISEYIAQLNEISAQCQSIENEKLKQFVNRISNLVKLYQLVYTDPHVLDH